MKISDFEEEHGPLLPGEEALVAGLGTGDTTPIVGVDLPGADAGEDRQIRADFLREIVLGKIDDAQPHEKGVQIEGARIIGELDLEGCELQQDLTMFACRFDAAPVLQSARMQNLFLNDSFLPGMWASRLEARGDVFLRNVEAVGAVRLLGAKLRGDLSCIGARFTAGEDGKALSADGLDTEGNVFLRNVEVTGTVRLLGAKLGGYLDCYAARFTAGEDGKAFTADRLDARGSVFLRDVETDGEVGLSIAKLGGNLNCTGARFRAGSGNRALQLQGVRVIGTFFLRKGTELKGVLYLSGAEIGHICDEEASWPDEGNLVLNRCRYGAFLGDDVDGVARLKWLALQDPTQFGDDFWPQPWEQCAKVLREMGHRGEARAVLIDKEKRQRAATRARLRRELLFEDAYWHGLVDWLMAVIVRYGHVPLLAVLWLVGFLLLGTGVFYETAVADAIKPNVAVVLRSPEWVGCAPGGAQNDGGSQLDCFLAQPQAKSYPRFNALIYSADTLLPIVDLEMQGYWIPDDRAASPWGPWARRFLWLEIAMGWALSLLAVAGFSGLIRTDSK